MRNLFLLLAFSFTASMAYSQIDLTVEIAPLRNNNGKILLEFSNDKEEVLKGISEDITDNKCIIRIPNLETGTYAFRYFHDENNDEEINTNFMGIPREGYGFSNNAKGSFGPPSFDKMLFELTKSDTLYCTPNYILKQK